MWYMKDYDFERPDSDYPGYEDYFAEDEDFEEVDDDFLDERELSHFESE